MRREGRRGKKSELKCARSPSQECEEVSLFFLTIGVSEGGRGSIFADHFRIGLCPLRKWRLEIFFFLLLLLLFRARPLTSADRTNSSQARGLRGERKKEAPDSQSTEQPEPLPPSFPSKIAPFCYFIPSARGKSPGKNTELLFFKGVQTAL